MIFNGNEVVIEGRKVKKGCKPKTYLTEHSPSYEFYT